MKLRLAPYLATALGAIAFASSAGAQVYKSTSNKSFATLFGSNDTNRITDTSVDAAGNRYVVGYTFDGSFHGYLMKLTKKGFKAFIVDATSLDGDVPTSVAADAAGHVYVTVSQDGSFVLRQYSASDGSLNWTTPEFNHGGFAYDMAIQPNGRPIVISDSQVQAGLLSGTVIRYPTDGSDYDGGFYVQGQDSHLQSVAIDANGGVYAVGQTYEAANTGATAAKLFYVMPAFNGWDSQSFDTAGSSEYFTEVAINPVTQTAIMVGGTYGTSMATSHPLLGSYFADYSSGSLVGKRSYYPFSYYHDGSFAQGIAVDEDGTMYMAVSDDTYDTPRANVYGMYSGDPSQPWILFYKWDQFVPASDAGSYDFAYDITTDGNGCVLGVLSDWTLGTGAAEYQGVQAFSFDKDGKALNRSMFGAPDISPINAFAGGFPKSAMSASGGFLSIFGNGNDGTPFDLTAQLVKGPNDSYRVDEDSTLAVPLSKGLLHNDGNQFSFAPMTCQVINSSVSNGFQSLVVNPDGTFTAKFNEDFNGVAHFNYRLKRGTTVLGSNHVTINVKSKNDVPVAVADVFSTAKNSVVQNLNVLANDYDVDGDNLTILSKTNDANATIGLSSDKKYITFKPKNNYMGDVIFQYTIRDPQGLQSTANVTVHIQ